MASTKPHQITSSSDGGKEIAQGGIACMIPKEKNSDTDESVAGGSQAAVSVFLVEDDPEILRLEGILLQIEDIPFLTFANGEAALEAFQKTNSKPKLLVTDYQMGGMTGLELIEKIRHIDPSVKTMLISGMVNREGPEAAHLQVDCFIQKPFKGNQLVAMIKMILNAGDIPPAIGA